MSPGCILAPEHYIVPLTTDRKYIPDYQVHLFQGTHPSPGSHDR